MGLKPKIIGYISVGVGIAMVFGVYTLIDSADKNRQSIFHVTLADPTMYQNGVFTDSFEIQEGSYYFAFVPNGDSPQTIAISLQGPNYYSMERFVLHSDFHDTGISEYYTWSYIGDEESTIKIPSSQLIQITIDPHENYDGPVSVSLKRISQEN